MRPLDLRRVPPRALPQRLRRFAARARLAPARVEARRAGPVRGALLFDVQLHRFAALVRT